MTEEISQFFDEFSKNYEDEIFKKTLGARYLSNIETQFIIDHCPIKKGALVLDIGIGTGRIAEIIVNKGAIVEAIDISEKMMEKAKKKLRGKPVNFKVADAGEQIPYPDNTFDYVVCIRVLKYIPTWEKTIKEVSRLIKKDGLFVLEIPNEYSVARFGLKGTKYFLFEPLKFITNLQNEGFEIQKIGAGSRLPFPLYVRVKNRLLLRFLNCLEAVMDLIFPKWFLSRNILISCRKR